MCVCYTIKECIIAYKPNFISGLKLTIQIEILAITLHRTEVIIFPIKMTFHQVYISMFESPILVHVNCSL